MNKLEIYDSEGNGLYPDGVDSSGRMSSYFDQHAFAVDATRENPIIEAYFRVEILGRPEQVSLRYTGDNPSTVFVDCRKAIKRELVNGQGWTILEPSGANPPEAVFWNGIWNSSTKTGSSDFFSHIRVGLDSDEIELLRYIADEDNDQALRFNVDRYQTVGDQLSRLLETGCSFSVSRPLQAPNINVDLQFIKKQNQTSNFELHADSKQLLEKKKQEHKEQKKQKELQDISKKITRLDQLGAKESEIKKTLNTSFGQTFSNLTVKERQEIENLKTKANHARTPNQSSSTKNRSSRSQSGTHGSHGLSSTGLRDIEKLLLIVVILILIGVFIAVITSTFYPNLLDSLIAKSAVSLA